MKIISGAFSVVLAMAATGAVAQQQMNGSGMMDQSGMGGGMMSGMMPGMMVAMMDENSDGSLSLQEFLAAHERMFTMADVNEDGQIEVGELGTFMGSGGMMGGDNMMGDGLMINDDMNGDDNMMEDDAMGDSDMMEETSE